MKKELQQLMAEAVILHAHVAELQAAVDAVPANEPEKSAHQVRNELFNWHEQHGHLRTRDEESDG